MDIGKRIKEIRREKKISQMDLANLLGITQATYSHLENRGSKLSFEQLEKIASALGVSVHYLILGENFIREYEKEIEEYEKEIEEYEKEIEEYEKEIEEYEKTLQDYREMFKILRATIEEKDRIIKQLQGK